MAYQYLGFVGSRIPIMFIVGFIRRRTYKKQVMVAYGRQALT